MQANVFRYAPLTTADAKRHSMESVAISVRAMFRRAQSRWLSSVLFFLGLSKREEVVEDEANAADEELTAYERDLEEDNDDLRQAIASEHMLENSQ